MKRYYVIYNLRRNPNTSFLIECRDNNGRFRKIAETAERLYKHNFVNLSKPALNTYEIKKRGTWKWFIYTVYKAAHEKAYGFGITCTLHKSGLKLSTGERGAIFAHGKFLEKIEELY